MHPDLMQYLSATERRALELAEQATPGDWTLNDRALAPVTWPEGASHLSDVAFAFLNVEHEDRDACIAALVFAASARTALPAALEAVAKARMALSDLMRRHDWKEQESARALLAEAGIWKEKENDANQD